MAAPILLFVQGPQKGHSQPLRKGKLVVGRSSQCDVVVEDPTASRKALELSFTPQGWVAENLSDRRLTVTDKKYKPGTQIALESGDWIDLGAETRLLFVADAEDARSVLASYRQAHPPQTDAAAPPPQPAQPPDEASGEPPAAEAPAARRQERTPAEQEAEQQKQAQAAKRRKYLIFGGIYALAMVVLVVILSSVAGGNDDGNWLTGRRPVRLADREIEDALDQRIDRQRNENLAQGHLEKARALHNRAMTSDRLGELHDCVKNYKLALAYGNAKLPSELTSAAGDGEAARLVSGGQLRSDDLDYYDAKSKYLDRVTEMYAQAWLTGKAGHWKESILLWEELEIVVPADDEWTTDGYRKLHRNILQHGGWARRQVPKK